MHSIEFSDNDLKMIRFERFHHPDRRVARRMEILSLKAAGFRQRDISRAAGVSRSTIGRLLNIYCEAGLSGVREFHEPGPTSPLTEHAGSLSEEFRLRPPSSTAEAAKRIEQLTGRLFRICNTTYINSHSVCELLKQIAQAGLQSPVTLVLDNARYQRCRLVEELAERVAAIGAHSPADASVPTLRPSCPLSRHNSQVATAEREGSRGENEQPTKLESQAADDVFSVSESHFPQLDFQALLASRLWY